MELVELRITGTVVTSQYGALSSGDILRTSPEFAKHLIDNHHAAEHVTTEKLEPKKTGRKGNK